MLILSPTYNKITSLVSPTHAVTNIPLTQAVYNISSPQGRRRHNSYDVITSDSPLIHRLTRVGMEGEAERQLCGSGGKRGEGEN